MLKILAIVFVSTLFLILSEKNSHSSSVQCEYLHNTWMRINRDFDMKGWSSDFSCPSEESTVAEMFYWVHRLDYDGANLNKHGDSRLYPVMYYDYIRENVRTITRGAHRPEASAYVLEAGSEEVFISRSFFEEYTSKGVPLGIVGASVLVHEARHAGHPPGGSPIFHVDCVHWNSDSGKGMCDGDFFLIRNLSREQFNSYLSNPKVGAYSLTLRFYLDAMLVYKSLNRTPQVQNTMNILSNSIISTVNQNFRGVENQISADEKRYIENVAGREFRLATTVR
ncbi:MAG: hypothetical protein JJ913_09170 [Rhizobiaceae bacterium]|nr:hypothetical protein [Rhizobiaceae bacterium]